jgi:hypothetical protein
MVLMALKVFLVKKVTKEILAIKVSRAKKEIRETQEIKEK